MFLITALLLPFRSGLNSTTISLALLLGVLFIATAFGSRPAFLASVIGILCFNFFFLPPFNTLHIADLDNLVAFGAFLLTALVAGQLPRQLLEPGAVSSRKDDVGHALLGELSCHQPAGIAGRAPHDDASAHLLS